MEVSDRIESYDVSDVAKIEFQSPPPPPPAPAAGARAQARRQSAPV